MDMSILDNFLFVSEPDTFFQDDSFPDSVSCCCRRYVVGWTTTHISFRGNVSQCVSLYANKSLSKSRCINTALKLLPFKVMLHVVGYYEAGSTSGNNTRHLILLLLQMPISTHKVLAPKHEHRGTKHV